MYSQNNTLVLDLVNEHIKQKNNLIEKGIEGYLALKYNVSKPTVEKILNITNNLKVKGFEKYIYPDGKECYYDKDFCFMTVNPEEVIYHYKEGMLNEN